MGTSDLLAIIGAAIALSAYLATVRARMFDKGKKDYATALMWADVPLILSGVTLAVCVGLRTYAGLQCEPGVNAGLGTFTFGLAALVCFHGYEWGKSLGIWK